MSADNNQWPPPQPGRNDDQPQRADDTRVAPPLYGQAPPWEDDTRVAPPLYGQAPPGPPGPWPATSSSTPGGQFGPPPVDHSYGMANGDPTVHYAAHQATADGLSPTPPTPSAGGRGLLVAGVLGGLATLGLLTAGVWALQDRGGGGEPTEPTFEAGGEPTSTMDPRIGSTVAGIDLRVGDCINYDNNGGNITTFDIVACTDPHLSEITAQIEHPAAARAYPGVDDLNEWSRNRCIDPTSRYLGAELLDTTLADTTLLPDFDDWSQGLYRISCLIGQFDESELTRSVEGAGAAFGRGDRVMVQRLKPGDCFQSSAPSDPLSLGRSDEVSLTDCSASPNGLFFGRDQLDFGSSEPFPGQDTVDSAAVAVCDIQFRRHFGADPTGFSYSYWSPGESTWILGNRSVECAMLDEEGLRPNIDYASFPTLFEVEPGSCFHLPPDTGIGSIDLDDRVEPVSCSAEFAGQIFAGGTIETSGPFPGPEGVDQQILELCEARFTEFVGVPSAESAFGDYTFWVPTEDGWRGGRPRYLCALLFEPPRTGSLENSAS